MQYIHFCSSVTEYYGDWNKDLTITAFKIFHVGNHTLWIHTFRKVILLPEVYFPTNYHVLFTHISFIYECKMKIKVEVFHLLFE
jgi:hypothetical protein